MSEKTDIKKSSPGFLLFTKCDNVLNYVHSQNDYPDFFFNQKVIPHKFSQIGLIMAKGDIDRDGIEDLIIGSSNKMPTTCFLQKSGRFHKKEFTGLSFIKNVSEADLAIADIDGDGLNDIVAVAGGLENQDEGAFIH